MRGFPLGTVVVPVTVRSSISYGSQQSGLSDSELKGKALETKIDELKTDLCDYNKINGKKMNQLSATVKNLEEEKQEADATVQQLKESVSNEKQKAAIMKDQLEKESDELMASLIREKQKAEEMKDQFEKESNELKASLSSEKQEAAKIKDQFEKERNELKESLSSEKQRASERKYQFEKESNQLKASLSSEKQKSEEMKSQFEREAKELKASADKAKHDNNEVIENLKNELKKEKQKGSLNEGVIKTSMHESTIQEQYNAQTIIHMKDHSACEAEHKRLEGKLHKTNKFMEDLIKSVNKELQSDIKVIFDQLNMTNKERQDLRSGTEKQLPELMEQLKETEKIVSEEERTSCQEKLCKVIHAITDKLFKNNEDNKERREELDKSWNSLADELEMKLRELGKNELKEELLRQLRKMRETVEEMRENDKKSAENLRMLEILLHQKEVELARLKEKLSEDFVKFKDVPKGEIFSELALTKIKKARLKCQLSFKETEINEKKEKIVNLKNEWEKERNKEKNLKAIVDKELKEKKRQNQELSEQLLQKTNEVKKLEIQRHKHEVKISNILQAVPTIKHLTHLNLLSSNIISLPDDLFLYQFERVRLSGNEQLQSLPSPGDCLKELIVDKCDIKVLPDDLFHHNLEIVSLIGNNGKTLLYDLTFSKPLHQNLRRVYI